MKLNFPWNRRVVLGIAAGPMMTLKQPGQPPDLEFIPIGSELSSRIEGMAGKKGRGEATRCRSAAKTGSGIM